MQLVGWEPFERLSRLHDRINDLFDEGLGGARGLPSATARVRLPPVDILASKAASQVRAELPGMNKEDFDLDVNDGTLTLGSERKAEPLTDGVAYHRAERVCGKCPRSFYLPQSVQQDGITANYRDGSWNSCAQRRETQAAPNCHYAQLNCHRRESVIGGEAGASVRLF